LCVQSKGQELLWQGYYEQGRQAGFKDMQTS